MTEDRKDPPTQNVLMSSANLPDDHPLKNLSKEQIRAEMRRSQQEQASIQLEVFAEPDSVKRIAQFSRALFLALVEEGFSEDQALEIVKSIGLPGRR